MLADTLEIFVLVATVATEQVTKLAVEFRRPRCSRR